MIWVAVPLIVTSSLCLYEYQLGFRHNHSVYMSLIILVDKILTSLSNGNYIIGLFLDFKKAFDTINHDILINKLEMYGIRGTSNKWIKSYLTDRYQFVEYDRVSSSRNENYLCTRDPFKNTYYFSYTYMTLPKYRLNILLWCLQMTQVYLYLAVIYIWWKKHLIMKWKSGYMAEGE